MLRPKVECVQRRQQTLDWNPECNMSEQKIKYENAMDSEVLGN